MGARLRSAEAAVLVVAAAALTGCTGSGPISVPQCLPPQLEVAPSAVAPGAELTVSSASTSCDLGYEAGHTYTLTVVVPRHSSPETVVPVATNGRFTATVTVPADFPPGDAAVIVHGSPYDDCDDGGGSGSCAGYAGYFTIR